MGKKSSILIALFIYLGTTEFAPHYFQLFALPLIFFIERDNFKLVDKYKLLTLMVALCVVNETIGISFGSIIVTNIFSIFPYFILIIFTIFLSDNINISIIKWILLFIGFEILIGIIQSLLGVQSFNNSVSLMNDGLLYNQKVYGLSSNSSGFSLKIFLGLLLFVGFRKKLSINKYIYISLIIIGLIITFNRTYIFGSVLFGLLYYYNIISKKESSKMKRWFIYLGVSLFFVVLIISFREIILEQLFRGRTDLSESMSALSERDLIYKYFWDFILENPWLGNNSFKLLFTTFDGRILHAHNSYLQLFATNGILIGSLFMFFIIKHINKDNYIFVLPILISGLLQYSIFWGTSFQDLVFYVILFSNFKLGRTS
jgi:hypothetical protein